VAVLDPAFRHSREHNRVLFTDPVSAARTWAVVRR
jgi:hypothetical protein